MTDGSGGVNSQSVKRMVGPNVSEQVKLQQLAWNLQSRTPVAARMVAGAAPPTKEEWQSITAPILVIAGEEVHPSSIALMAG